MLTLAAGTYFVQQGLMTEPDATIVLSGEVELNVASGSVFHRGQIIDSDGNPAPLFLRYLGTQTVSLETVLDGTVVAPAGAIALAGSGLTYAGSYIGRNITVAPDVEVVHVPFVEP